PSAGEALPISMVRPSVATKRFGVAGAGELALPDLSLLEAQPDRSKLPASPSSSDNSSPKRAFEFMVVRCDCFDPMDLFLGEGSPNGQQKRHRLVSKSM